MIDRYTLRNKVNVILAPEAGASSVTVLVMYPVGSRHESEKMRGVSHYIEHLMFKGTKKRKNTLTLTREIDRLGAEYNAFTGKEYTGYYIKTDVAYTETALDILSDMLFHSTFDPKEMESEKKVIVEEIKMYNDNPLMNIDNIFEEVMYDGCPMGWDIAGTAKHVLGYHRKDVLAYRDRYYQPRNMTVVIAGAVTDETRTQVEHYFGSEKNRGPGMKKCKPGVFGSSAKSKRLRIQQKETDQAQLMLGFPSFKFGDKRLVPLSVLNTIFGGSMSSRLFIRIRERLGLAYMVRSGSDQYDDTGYSYIRVGLDPGNINKAIAAIEKEIKKLVDKGVSKRELEDAKTHMRGAMALSMEDSSTVANWYARFAVHDAPLVSPDKWLTAVDRVTREDIARVAKQVFKMNQMRVGIIGNVSSEDIKF